MLREFSKLRSVSFSERIAHQLDRFWEALPGAVRLLSDQTPSRRFPELTYIREELLGSYKARKYVTLIPWLKEQGFQRVRVRGSSHSGNVTQLGLLLREHGMEPIYLKEGRGGPPAGNVLLSKLVYGEAFEAEDCGAVDYEIPEGGSCLPALAGSLGLAGSLIEQSLREKHWVEDLYIDAGTGFSAAALLMGLGYFELPCRVFIVTMTGQTEDDFHQLVTRLEGEFKTLLGVEPTVPSFSVHRPPAGPSFGSVPTASLAEVQEFARREGILVDPIYTAKLSLAYKELRDPGREARMFVSGGVRELLCFQGPLRKWL